MFCRGYPPALFWALFINKLSHDDFISMWMGSRIDLRVKSLRTTYFLIAFLEFYRGIGMALLLQHVSALFITLLYITSTRATLSLLGSMHQFEDFGYPAPNADENIQRDEIAKEEQLPFYRDVVDRSSYITTEARSSGEESRDSRPSTLIHAPLILSNPFFNLARSIFRRSQRNSK